MVAMRCFQEFALVFAINASIRELKEVFMAESSVPRKDSE